MLKNKRLEFLFTTRHSAVRVWDPWKSIDLSSTYAVLQILREAHKYIIGSYTMLKPSYLTAHTNIPQYQIRLVTVIDDEWAS